MSIQRSQPPHPPRSLHVPQDIAGWARSSLRRPFLGEWVAFNAFDWAIFDAVKAAYGEYWWRSYDEFVIDREAGAQARREVVCQVVPTIVPPEDEREWSSEPQPFVYRLVDDLVTAANAPSPGGVALVAA